MTEPGISVKEFARRMQVSDTAVHKAIRAGKIVKGTAGEGKSRVIYPTVAEDEWRQAFDPSYAGRSKALDKRLAAPVATSAPIAGTNPDTGAKVAQNAPGAAASVEDTSLAAAKRVQAVLKAQQMRLELEQAQGRLVDKNAVYDALYAAGAEVRSAIMAVPDRCIDDLMACKTRAEAFTLLHEALAEALQTVTEVLNRGVNVKR